MRVYLSIFVLLCIWGKGSAQQTVGLFQSDSSAYPGYTLFAPTSSTETYLIDMCGREINSWSSQYGPGNSAYLLEDGSLLRTARIPSPVFSAGGIGGRIERRNWQGNMLWAYNYADSLHHQHHDIEFLPNGNLLILAWELKSPAEAIAAGRDSNLINFGLWPESIVEITPIGTDSLEIVWEWHAWDHLVQDLDSLLPNFGSVSDHPELFDLNYVPINPGPDWMHVNSIDYHPGLDQIVLSSRHWDEIWIIDHSTSPQEAASHSGGLSGKGGDILYRWGNPASYQRGGVVDHHFFGQHDANWIADSMPGGGGIMVYNNGGGRPAGNFSTVDIVVPPLDLTGGYTLNPGAAYGPATPNWTYQASPNPFNFYSPNISGAQRLPNGNTLICEGATGHFFEIDSSQQIVWDYINPVNFNGPISQGNTIQNNGVFRAPRYDRNYPGLAGKDLSPGLPIEQNPIPVATDCEYLMPLNQLVENEPQVFPNPMLERLNLTYPGAFRFRLMDSSGQIRLQGEEGRGSCSINTRELASGLYFLEIIPLRATTAPIHFKLLKP